MRKHKSARIMSVLAALILNTACSTTDQTTITAPADDAPAPTDSTPAPSAPTDDTSPTDTGTPTDDTGIRDDTSTPTTASDQDFVEVTSVVFNYPNSWLANDNDRSTPLGKLCWAVREYISIDLARSYQEFADNIPGFEVIFSSNDEGESVGPVGVTNEESEDPTIGTDDYFLDTLGAIQGLGIVGIVNDDELSDGLQQFAQEFFSYVAAFDEQIKAVGYENIDQAILPYQDFNDLPNVEEFTQAIEDNPDKCKFPTEEEITEELAKLDQYVTKN